MDRAPRSPVTLKDIAKASGYSVNTVSRALRNKDDIAEKTKNTIKQISDSMGYINNALASSLRSGRTNMIAVILGDISNPHFGIMMKEIENRAQHYGYTSFLINTNENENSEREAIEMALNKNVDGIIICAAQQSSRNIEYIMDTYVPFVQIGRHNKHLRTNYVVCNDELGGYQATRYLIENGHKDILMLGGSSYISSAKERLAGYVRALTESGIPIKRELIHEVQIITSDNTSENNGGSRVKQILELGLEFSAIFAFSDIIAWEAWAVLEKKGLKIPEECSIVGFDNIQSRIIIPRQLSTISSYKTKMSTIAVDCLVAKMRKEIAEEVGCIDKICNHVINTQLIKGETVIANKE